MTGQQFSTANLTESQNKAVWHKDGPLLVIAGPGSGKTRVITNRVAALVSQGVRSSSICAITFTNKAAEEMRNRVYSMNVPSGVHLSTFHSLCVRILKQFAEQAKVSPNFSIYSDADQKNCIKKAIKDCDLDSKNFQPAKMLEIISRLKNNLQDVADFEADSAGDYFSQCVAKVYRNYQKNLSKSNALDFDDLLLKTAFLLRDCDDVRKQMNNRFRYLMVDEYQDTNQAQYQIAKGLALEHGNICVTGDPDQSIYGWRGADIGNILAFEHDWPDAVVVKLQENFRSTPKILSTADSLVSCNKSRKQKKLVPTLPESGKIVTRCLDSEYEEADFVAEQIKTWLDSGKPASEIAVFYRVNSMSRAVEEALVENQVPYQIVRGVEFYSRREIRDMLGYLRLIVNDSDDQAFLRVINTPARGIGKVTVAKLADYAASRVISLYEAAKNCADLASISAGTKTKLKKFTAMIEDMKACFEMPVAKFMDKVFKDSGMFTALQVESAKEDYSKASPLDNVAELIAAAERFDTQEHGTAVDFLQRIALFSDTDTYDSASGKVSLMTLHCAKGLEFDNVCIIGLEQGILPHDRSIDTLSEVEEERRLFFVGLTRARQNLCVTLSRYRTVHGQTNRTIESQFLFEAGLSPQQASANQGSFDDLKDEMPKDTYYQSDSCDDTEDISKLFTVGQLVSHKKFGTGRVKEFRNLGDNSIVVVQFRTGATKPLMLKYANLSVID